MRTNGDSVDDAAQVDVHGVWAWWLQLAIAVDGEVQIVGAWAYASIGEYVVDSAMLVFGCFEQFREVGPLPDIGLHEKEIASCRGALDIATDDGGAER
jgi:hypothetical protein